MSNKDKIILDLCGGTGAWSKPYKEAGYDVRLVTLPEHDVLNYTIPSDMIYGILAAPPCTMFSLARQNAKSPRDFEEGMKTVRACLEIIWACRCNGNLKFWCLENPTGYLRQFLGKPVFKFKPNEFGDPCLKRTDLWGYFKEPKKLKKPIAVEVCKAKGSERQSMWFATRRKPAARAITPPKFAKSFFEANK